jgi:hypothetical protein
VDIGATRISTVLRHAAVEPTPVYRIVTVSATAARPSGPEPPAKRVRIHEELERLHAVDLDHGDALAIAALQVGIPGDVDLLEVERDLGTHLLEDPARALAEVAALGRVQTDAPRRYG